MPFQFRRTLAAMLSMTLGAPAGALFISTLILFVNGYRWVERTSDG